MMLGHTGSMLWALLIAEACWGASSTITPRELSNAINMAGRQRMLSQKMSKEFLLLAQGHEVDHNKDALLASIALFDGSLQKLIGGSPADGIPAAPTANVLLELNRVSDLWSPFKANLEGNMNRSPIPADAINYVVGHNVALLQQANVAVSRLVDAARGMGIETAGLQVDIAGRQRMLSQRMSKELMMIALSIDVPQTTQELKGTIGLFSDSHRGLLRGVPEMGLPETRNICALQGMRSVTGHWLRFRGLLDQVVYGSGVTPAILQDVADLNPVLLTEMNSAVTTYVTEPTDCPGSTTSGDWLRALVKAGHAQQSLWHSGRLLMMVVQGVGPTSTRNALTAMFTTAETQLRAIIEGSVSEQIGSPVTQASAGELVDGWNMWAQFQASAEGMVANMPVALQDIERSFTYGTPAYTKVESGFQLYLQAVAAADPELPTGAVALATEMGVQAERLALEALLGLARRDPSSAVKVQQASTTFARAKDELLKGRAASGSAVAVNRTRDACALRQMREVSMRWEPLAASAARVSADLLMDSAAGVPELPALCEHASDIFDSLSAAVDLYAFGPQGCDLAVTGAQWELLITTSGRVKAFSQRALTYRVLAARGLNIPGSVARVSEAEATISIGLENLTYGTVEIPSPPTQEIADLLLRLADTRPADAGRRLSDDYDTWAYELEALPILYTEALARKQAASTSSYLEGIAPARSLEAVRQWVRSERILRFAAELQPGKPERVTRLREEMATLQAMHYILLNGNGLERGEPGYIPETSEAQKLPALQKMYERFPAVKARALAIADAGYAGNEELLALAADVGFLVVEAERMVELFSISSKLAKVEDLRILVPLPLTGRFQPGGAMRVAATLAVEIMNEQQWVLPGVRIQTVFVNDHCSVQKGLKAMLDEITSNTSYAGIAGMACSDVCAKAAIVANSVNIPALSFACQATFLSDQYKYPGFPRLGTTMGGTAKLVVYVMQKFGWTFLEAISDTTYSHAQDPRELVEGIREYGGVEVHWQTAGAGNWDQIRSKVKYIVKEELRQVLLLGNEFFVRSVACVCMLEGIAPGMTWISTGPKRRGWLKEDYSYLIRYDARCTGAALWEYMKGTLNIRATGMANPAEYDDPLACMRGHTPHTFLDLVRDRVASMNNSFDYEEYGRMDYYSGMIGLAADGICVLAKALGALQARGYSIEELHNRNEAAYNEAIAYIQDHISFFGISGNVSFDGNDKPGDLGLWQYTDYGDTEVGIEYANGSIDLTLYGGPNAEVWRGHPAEPQGFRFPWEYVAIGFLFGSVALAGAAGSYAASRYVRARKEKERKAADASGRRDSAGSWSDAIA